MWSIWLQDVKEPSKNNKSKLVKKVLTWFSGGNKKMVFVKWVQFLGTLPCIFWTLFLHTIIPEKYNP